MTQRIDYKDKVVDHIDNFEQHQTAIQNWLDAHFKKPWRPELFQSVFQSMPSEAYNVRVSIIQKEAADKARMLNNEITPV